MKIPFACQFSIVRTDHFSLYGTIPVLLVLGQLLGETRTSFMYMTSSDLIVKDERKPDKEKLFGELDLICIKDGKFIIGEIKQSMSLFSANDFDKIFEIASLIKPDSIIFSSMDHEKPNRIVEAGIKELSQKLSHLKIKVEWYHINYWVFEARPIR